jgi:hypothetical protein
MKNIDEIFKKYNVEQMEYEKNQKKGEWDSKKLNSLLRMSKQILKGLNQVMKESTNIEFDTNQKNVIKEFMNKKFGPLIMESTNYDLEK